MTATAAAARRLEDGANHDDYRMMMTMTTVVEGDDNSAAALRSNFGPPEDCGSEDNEEPEAATDSDVGRRRDAPRPLLSLRASEGRRWWGALDNLP